MGKKHFLSDDVERVERFVKIANKYVRKDKDDKYETYVNSCGDKVVAIAYILTKDINIRGYIKTNMDMIMEDLGWNEFKRGKTESINMIRETLNYMVQEGIFEFDKDFNDLKRGDTILIQRHNFLQITAKEYSQGVYFAIKDFQFDKIINIKGIDNFKLLNLFCTITSRFNNGNTSNGCLHDCFVSNKKIQEDIGMDERTTKKYVEILHNNDLIKYDNAGDRLTATGEYKTSPNNYVSFDEDWEERLKDSIKFFKKTQKEKYGVEFLPKTNNEDTKEKKSLVGKISYLEGKDQLNKKEKTDLAKFKKKLNKINEKYNREYVEETDEEYKRINDETMETLYPEMSRSDAYDEIEKFNYSAIAYEEENHEDEEDDDFVEVKEREISKEEIERFDNLFNKEDEGFHNAFSAYIKDKEKIEYKEDRVVHRKCVYAK